MNSTQIICLIGIMIVCFILGRKSKKSKFPIAGTLIFENDKPSIEFNMQFKDMVNFHYVVFKIRGRINDDNERRSE